MTSFISTVKADDQTLSRKRGKRNTGAARPAARSKADVCERMRRWRAENAEKNRNNDMRCRVYRLARQRFGLEDTPERQEWIQKEINRRIERRRLRENCKQPSFRESHSYQMSASSANSPDIGKIIAPTQGNGSSVCRSTQPSVSPTPSYASAWSVGSCFSAPPPHTTGPFGDHSTSPSPASYYNRSSSSYIPRAVSHPPLHTVEPQFTPRGPVLDREPRDWLRGLGLPLTSTLSRHGWGCTSLPTTPVLKAEQGVQPVPITQSVSEAAYKWGTGTSSTPSSLPSSPVQSSSSGPFSRPAPANARNTMTSGVQQLDDCFPQPHGLGLPSKLPTNGTNHFATSISLPPMSQLV
ncbi:hypothetical protein IWQ62_006095 [Dispira parvispora]|uniref:DUF3020 domain-containing protein n=1 Tax=Dispira parvispora TaxID=1520584 RepID=A0A9W8ANP4_9FUNG|nr:hypothetical protein IWQ62_006095 [Dispira parvispora]